MCNGNNPNPSSLCTDKWGSLFPCVFPPVSTSASPTMPHNAPWAHCLCDLVAAVAMALWGTLGWADSYLNDRWLSKCTNTHAKRSKERRKGEMDLNTISRTDSCSRLWWRTVSRTWPWSGPVGIRAVVSSVKIVAWNYILLSVHPSPLWDTWLSVKWGILKTAPRAYGLGRSTRIYSKCFK